MALWMVRNGEHEQYFLQTNRAYITWSRFNHDLSKLSTKAELRHLLRQRYPEFKEKKIINHSGQIWPFAREMQLGDWLLIPSKEIGNPHRGDHRSLHLRRQGD